MASKCSILNLFAPDKYQVFMALLYPFLDNWENTRMNRNNAVLSGGGLDSALECAGFQIDLACAHIEQLGNPEAGVEENENDINVRLILDIPQSGDLFLGEGGSIGWNRNGCGCKLRIHFVDDVTFKSKAVEMEP